jgi:hypothetical protein
MKHRDILNSVVGNPLHVGLYRVGSNFKTAAKNNVILLLMINTLHEEESNWLKDNVREIQNRINYCCNVYQRKCGCEECSRSSPVNDRNGAFLGSYTSLLYL